MTKPEATSLILAAKKKKKLSWAQIADKIGKSPVWVTSACLGMNSMPPEFAVKLGRVLGLSKEIVSVLQECPHKSWEKSVPTDPLVYRLYEIVGVYGDTIKTLIHEEFGDGIMSAIDFGMEIERIADPKGDRVKITMHGKFLPYKHW